MARYIDADKIKKAIKDYGKGCISGGIKTLDVVDDVVYIAGLVDMVSTADVQEVKHGKWVLAVEYKSCAYHATASCSECGWEWIGKDGECVGSNKYVFGAFVVSGSKEAEQFVIDNARKRKLYNYCPDCGAKMDKE